MIDTAGLIAALVFLLVAGALLISTSGEKSHERVGRRLAGYMVDSTGLGVGQRLSILRERTYSRIRWLDVLLRRLDFADRLAESLKRAGVPMRPGEFLLIQILLAAGATAGVSMVAPPGPFRIGGMVGAAVLGLLLPRLWLRFKRARRLSTFEREFPDALDLVAGSLRAGYGVAHGLELVSKEMLGPCGEEFGQVLQEVNLGSNLDEALARLVDRVPSEDAQILATAVAIQRRTGGNLVEVLGMITGMVRERLRVRGEVRTITTAPRISGYVVALLPVGTAVMMFITSRYYVDMLLNSPLGQVALLCSATLTAIGLLLNRRIAQVEL
jgi:tight adherence protein B